MTRQFVSRARLIENLRLLQDSNLRELQVSMSTRNLPGNWKDIVDSRKPVLFCLGEGGIVHPVRLGNMLDIRSYPNRLECRISCQEFVSGVEPDFQSWFAERYQYLPILDAIPLPDEMLSFSESVSGEYWHHVAKSLSQLESYNNTVFWRIIGIEDDETPQLVLDLENEVAVGGSYRKELQIIDSDTGDIIKQVDAERSREIKIEMPSFAIPRCYEIASYPIRHSSLMEKIEIPPCTVLPPEKTGIRDVMVDKNDQIRQQAVRQLWCHIDEDTSTNLETKIELLARYVLPSFPDDTDLVENLAEAYLESDCPEEAYNRLRDLNPNRLSGNGAMILFRAATAVGADYPYEDIIPLIDLQTENQMNVFVQAVEELGENQAMRLLECLANIEVLLLAQAVELMSEGYFTEPPNILKVIGFLELSSDDPENRVFRYLVNQCERYPHLETNPQLVKLYIDYGEKSDESPKEAFVRQAIKYCVQDGNTEMVERFVKLAKKRLDPRVFEYVIDDTYGHLCDGGPFLRELAAGYVCDIVDSLLNVCDLAGSSKWLRRLIATFGKEDPSVGGRISRLQDRWNNAFNDTEIHRLYQARDENAICTRLKGVLSEKVLVVVGGLKPDYAGELEENLGLKELKWYECERNRNLDIKSVREKLRNPHCCGLLKIISHMGHDVEAALEPIPENLPVAKAQLGKRAILNALTERFLPSA